MNGALCPYHQHEPTTIEGWQTWDLGLRLNGQLRVGPGGQVLGFDLTSALALTHSLGFDERAMAELLPSLEAGMVSGFRKRREDAET